MSLKACKMMAAEERKACGMVDGELVKIKLKRSVLPFQKWVVYVFAFGVVSTERFYRRKSADNHFEDLVRNHGLKPEEEKV